MKRLRSPSGAKISQQGWQKHNAHAPSPKRAGDEQGRLQQQSSCKDASQTSSLLLLEFPAVWSKRSLPAQARQIDDQGDLQHRQRPPLARPVPPLRGDPLPIPRPWLPTPAPPRRPRRRDSERTVLPGRDSSAAPARAARGQTADAQARARSARGAEPRGPGWAEGATGCGGPRPPQVAAAAGPGPSPAPAPRSHRPPAAGADRAEARAEAWRRRLPLLHVLHLHRALPRGAVQSLAQPGGFQRPRGGCAPL